MKNHHLLLFFKYLIDQSDCGCQFDTVDECIRHVTTNPIAWLWKYYTVEISGAASIATSCSAFEICHQQDVKIFMGDFEITNVPLIMPTKDCILRVQQASVIKTKQYYLCTRLVSELFNTCIIDKNVCFHMYKIVPTIHGIRQPVNWQLVFYALHEAQVVYYTTHNSLFCNTDAFRKFVVGKYSLPIIGELFNMCQKIEYLIQLRSTDQYRDFEVNLLMYMFCDSYKVRAYFKLLGCLGLLGNVYLTYLHLQSQPFLKLHAEPQTYYHQHWNFWKRNINIIKPLTVAQTREFIKSNFEHLTTGK